METELWEKKIEGFDYWVSTHGRIRSKYKIRKLRFDNFGYLRLGIWKNNIRTEFSIHRLVAKVFIPNPDNLPQVKHKDENRENNHFDNLEWVSRSGNMNKTKIYLMMDPRGSRVEIQDMTEFCKNNPGLNRHHMLSIHSERKNRHGNMIKYHKGWSKWYDQ